MDTSTYTQNVHIGTHRHTNAHTSTLSSGDFIAFFGSRTRQRLFSIQSRNCLLTYRKVPFASERGLLAELTAQTDLHLERRGREGDGARGRGCSLRPSLPCHSPGAHTVLLSALEAARPGEHTPASALQRTTVLQGLVRKRGGRDRARHCRREREREENNVEGGKERGRRESLGERDREKDMKDSGYQGHSTAQFK